MHFLTLYHITFKPNNLKPPVILWGRQVMPVIGYLTDHQSLYEMEIHKFYNSCY